MTNPSEEFKKSSYLVIRNLVEPSEIDRIYHYTLHNLHNGNLKDTQAPGSPSFYQDKEMTILHKKVLSKLEPLLALKLFSTFSYYRTYRTGAILRAHKDRKSCDIAVSLNLGQKGKLWDIWLLDHDENARNITLAPGDGLIYKGCQLTHWRGKLTDADFVSQAFFFFLDQQKCSKFTLGFEEVRKFIKRCRNKLGITSY